MAAASSVQQLGLPESTVRAIAALNFATKLSPLPDLSVLEGYTPENTKEKVAAVLPNASEAQLQQYVTALMPAVEKLTQTATSSASAETASSGCPIDVVGLFNKAAAAASASAPAEPSVSRCPIDVAGLFEKAVKAASAPAGQPAAPTPAVPSAASLPQATVAALTSLNFAINRVAKPDLAVLKGWTPANTVQKLSALLPSASEQEIAQFASSLKVAVEAANAPAAKSAAPRATAGPSLPARPSGPSTGAGGLSMLPTRGTAPRAAAPGGGGAPAAAARPGMAAAAAAAAAAPIDDPNESKEVRELRSKVQDIRVMLFRLAKRLEQRGSLVNQVEYRISLAERIKLTTPGTPPVRRASPFDAAREKAEQLEAADSEGDLNFSCTVMLLGMTGCGKTATINSLLGTNNGVTNAFEPETKKIRVLSGMVCGVRMKFIDTPGLLPSASSTGKNMRILSQAKAAYKRHKPDIILYVDRMDVVQRDFGDLPLLRSITEMFGPQMWFNTIVVLTHGSTAPPEGVTGQISYDVYANHRSHILQQTIRQAVGDMRVLNLVTYAENHPNCRRNTDGKAVLPNGVVWQQNLLLYVLSSKLLGDSEKILKIQGSASQMVNPGSQKIPPLPYLLSNVIQTKAPRKPPEDEREIKSMNEMAKLPDEERKMELRKRKEFEKMRADEAKADADSKTQVAVPAPDPALQPTFDSDSNGHRYRFLESAGGWIVRPFVEAHGVDHDDGVEGFSCEKGTMLRPRGQYLGGIPANAMFQLQKDKNLFSFNGEAEASHYLSKNVISTATMEVQTIGGRDMVYTSRLETRVKNHPRNKTAAGVVASRLADNQLPLKGPVALGLKAENRTKVMDNVKAIISGGMMSTKTRVGRETARAANAEMRLKGDTNQQLTVGASLMHWRRDLLLAGNISGQAGVTPETMVTTRANLNSKATGQLQVRVTSHDYPLLGLSMLLPLSSFLYEKIFRGDVY